jgi:hypothetical protein
MAEICQELNFKLYYDGPVCSISFELERLGLVRDRERGFIFGEVAVTTRE